MDLWMRNKDGYVERYFKNGKPLDTKYLKFGKNIAQLIEERKHNEILPDLIVYDISEFKIETEIRGVPILSFIDSYDPVSSAFREYKTGKNPWTAVKVEKHGQLLFYAVALKAVTGTYPKYCHLDWIETQMSESDDMWNILDPQIELTGKIKSFLREFNEKEIDMFEEKIQIVAQEISDAYKKFISEI
jgi:hypothetical protein